MILFPDSWLWRGFPLSQITWRDFIYFKHSSLCENSKQKSFSSYLTKTETAATNGLASTRTARYFSLSRIFQPLSTTHKILMSQREHQRAAISFPTSKYHTTTRSRDRLVCFFATPASFSHSICRCVGESRISVKVEYVTTIRVTEKRNFQIHISVSFKKFSYKGIYAFESPVYSHGETDINNKIWEQGARIQERFNSEK